MESAITVLSWYALLHLLAPPCAQDSLLRLKDHRQCFECSDVALHEAVQQMVNVSESAAKEEWVATVTQLLLGIEQALSADNSGSILKESSSSTGLTRLTNNLIQVTRLSFLRTSPCFIAHRLTTTSASQGDVLAALAAGSGHLGWQVAGGCALAAHLPGAGRVWGVESAEHLAPQGSCRPPLPKGWNQAQSRRP